MDSIKKVRSQKSKVKSAILLMAIYGIMLANPGSQVHQKNDGTVMMPAMTVTAQRPIDNLVMMPALTVTAPRPISNSEIAMATDRPALYVKQVENPGVANRVLSFKELKRLMINLGTPQVLTEPDLPTELELIKSKVNIKVDRYSTREGKMIIKSSDTVKEDIKFSGGNAIIDGVLDGDFSVTGGNVELNGLIDGEVAILGGAMNVAGKIKGDAAVLGGDITNKGTIDGDVMVAGGNIKLDSGSVVTGDIAIIGGSIEKDTNATIKGEVKSVNIKILNKTLPKLRATLKYPHIIPSIMTHSASALALVLALGGLFVIALLVLLIFPKSITSVSEKTQVNVWIPIAIGFGMQILVVPLIVLLAVSLIGIPIIPLFMIGLFICFLVGITSVLFLVGSRIKHTDDPKQGLIGKFALGFIIVMAIPILGALIRIISPIGGLFTAIGAIVIYVVATIGLGAAFYTLVTHKKQ